MPSLRTEPPPHRPSRLTSIHCARAWRSTFTSASRPIHHLAHQRIDPARAPPSTFAQHRLVVGGRSSAQREPPSGPGRRVAVSNARPRTAPPCSITWLHELLDALSRPRARRRLGRSSTAACSCIEALTKPLQQRRAARGMRVRSASRSSKAGRFLASPGPGAAARHPAPSASTRSAPRRHHAVCHAASAMVARARGFRPVPTSLRPGRRRGTGGCRRQGFAWRLLHSRASWLQSRRRLRAGARKAHALRRDCQAHAGVGAAHARAAAARAPTPRAIARARPRRGSARGQQAAGARPRRRGWTTDGPRSIKPSSPARVFLTERWPSRLATDEPIGPPSLARSPDWRRTMSSASPSPHQAAHRRTSAAGLRFSTSPTTDSRNDKNSAWGGAQRHRGARTHFLRRADPESTPCGWPSSTATFSEGGPSSTGAWSTFPSARPDPQRADPQRADHTGSRSTLTLFEPAVRSIMKVSKRPCLSSLRPRWACRPRRYHLRLVHGVQHRPAPGRRLRRGCGATSAPPSRRSMVETATLAASHSPVTPVRSGEHGLHRARPRLRRAPVDRTRPPSAARTGHDPCHQHRCAAAVATAAPARASRPRRAIVVARSPTVPSHQVAFAVLEEHRHRRRRPSALEGSAATPCKLSRAAFLAACPPRRWRRSRAAAPAPAASRAAGHRPASGRRSSARRHNQSRPRPSRSRRGQSASPSRSGRPTLTAVRRPSRA